MESNNLHHLRNSGDKPPRLHAPKSTAACFLYAFFLFIIYPGPRDAQAQEQGASISAFNYSFISHKQAPFWHYANRDGSLHAGSTLNNITGLTVSGPVVEPLPGLRFHTVAGAVNRFSDQRNSLHFQQIYGRADYGVLSLKAGRFFDTMGFHNPDLSTGSMIVSRNATPFPKISLETNTFADIPLTNGRLRFHARFSEGILEKDRFTQSPRVHQKSLYLKFTIGPFQGIGGVIHNVMWGGDSPQYGNMSYSLDDYLRIVFSRPASQESNLPGTGNRLGNTVAAYDFAAIFTLYNYRIHAYRLFYLEDTPATRFRSPWDGIWGAGFERTNGNGIINSITYEHMNTITQDAKDHIPAGRADYYNHNSVYKTGWSYHGRALGNPLLTFDREEGIFVNNMVLAHHIGMSGELFSRAGYRLLLTYNRNYGRCADRVPGRCSSITTGNPAPDEWDVRPRSEFRRDRYSALLEGRYQISVDHRINLIGSLAFDLGEFSAPRAGVMAGFEIGY